MAERIGPGRPPRDPYDIVAYTEHVTDTGVNRVPVTVIDRVVETLAANAFVHDAAARAGLSTETLRVWRRKGEQATADLLAGRKRLSELDTHTKRCVELAERMTRAEAEARVLMMGTMTQLARGGLDRTKVVEKIDATTGNVMERVTQHEKLLPDTRAIAWILSHRYPHDFADRVEVTGAGGGAVKVETARDRLMEAIAGVRSRGTNGDDAIDVAHRPAGELPGGNGGEQPDGANGDG